MSTSTNSYQDLPASTTLRGWYILKQDVLAAIAREKQIKGWLRSKKLALIDAQNPTWEDLSSEWFDGATT
jgi:predicted GIY-YIG superfamily endonuclease